MSSEEYLRRLSTPFVLPTHTLAQVHAAVPKHLYAKPTLKSLTYVFRDIALALVFVCAATHIDATVTTIFTQIRNSSHHRETYPLGVSLLWKMTEAASFRSVIPILNILEHCVRLALWITYWVLESLTGAGMWSLGHEAGHGSLSSYAYINDIIGFTLHSVLLVPYYSWRATHHAHHRSTSSVERDENYVPSTRSSLKLPPRTSARISDYHDIFEETPIYTLLRILAMQTFGWHAYLCWNALGSPMYPRGTNHFDPSSKLFKSKDRFYIHLSNAGLAGMAILLYFIFRPYGLGAFTKYYFIPYLIANHWIVMLTYLHHTDPSIPHYRKDEWSFLRGAAATVDRPLLGRVGRFFLHNTTHDHVAHHHFPMIPFYNQPQVTQAIKPILGHSYNYDSTNGFYALYRSFTECQFIEDDDAVAFYKNKAGVAQRFLADDGKSK